MRRGWRQLSGSICPGPDRGRLLLGRARWTVDTLQTRDAHYHMKCSLKSTFTRAKDQRSKNCEILIFIRIKISKIKVLWSKKALKGFNH